jgi:Protein of unknown function (DUF2510)/Glucodextranase, domain B
MGQGGQDALRAVGPLASWVPAGWYPDPIGQGAARYWDGSRWTGRYRDAPGPQPIPSSPGEVPTVAQTPQTTAVHITPPTSPPGPRRGLLRNPWFWGVIGGFVLIIVIAGVVGGGSKGSSSTPTKQVAAEAPHTPSVELHLNQGGYTQTGETATLTGTVARGASVHVNGQRVPVHGTNWSVTVHLNQGENTEQIEASLPGHTSSNESITVTRNESPAEEAAKHEHEEQEYKAKAETVSFAELNKDTQRYVGHVVTYEGQVFQIQEEGEEGGWMLVEVTKGEFGLWSNPVYVTFHRRLKANEKSIVTFWGEVKGTKSYETKIGGNNEVPEIDAKYVSD